MIWYELYLHTFVPSPQEQNGNKNLNKQTATPPSIQWVSWRCTPWHRHSCTSSDKRQRLRADCYAPAAGDIKRYCDPSVCLSHGAAALGYRHAGCLQLRHVRTADLSAGGRRSAASRTAIDGGMSSHRPRGDNLFSLKLTAFSRLHSRPIMSQASITVLSSSS